MVKTEKEYSLQSLFLNVDMLPELKNHIWECVCKGTEGNSP